MEPIERYGHENRPESVNGGEGPDEHAGSVLVVARLHHGEMVDGLEHEPEHAADREYPEQVEEVEGYESLARFVAAERAVFGRLARFHVAQFTLQFALLRQRGVEVALHDNKEHGYCTVGSQA